MNDLAESKSGFDGTLTPLELAVVRVQEVFASNKVPFLELPSATAVRHTQAIEAVGWQVELPPDYLGLPRKLNLVFPKEFPHRPPSAHVAPSAYCDWPHCERDGRLCLWPDETAPVGFSPNEIVDDFFERIGRVLAFSTAGSDPEIRAKEFRDEWIQYWRPRNLKRTGQDVLFLGAFPESVTPLYATQMQRPGMLPVNKPRGWSSFAVAATDLERIEPWTSAFTEWSPSEAAIRGLFIPCDQPPGPGMPDSLEGLVRILEAHCKGAADEVHKLLGSVGFMPVWLIVGAPCVQGTGLACVELQPQQLACPPQRSKYENRKTREHRKRRREANPTWKVAVTNVERADDEWIIDRGFASETAKLRKATVSIIGCGALGSSVAESLAKAGVGRINVIEPQTLEPANIGRHALGAGYVMQKKAHAMAHYLRTNFPGVAVAVKDVDVRRLNVTEEVFNADLLICAAANWEAERFLLDHFVTGRFRGALQLGWSEPFGCAGHSLLFVENDFDPSEFFDDSGKFHRRMTEWPGELVSKRLPGCGATYMPAGILAIRPIATLMSQHAVDFLTSPAQAKGEHRTFFTSIDAVTRSGGSVINGDDAGDMVCSVKRYCF